MILQIEEYGEPAPRDPSTTRQITQALNSVTETLKQEGDEQGYVSETQYSTGLVDLRIHRAGSSGMTAPIPRRAMLVSVDTMAHLFYLSENWGARGFYAVLIDLEFGVIGELDFNVRLRNDMQSSSSGNVSVPRNQTGKESSSVVLVLATYVSAS